MENLHDFFFQIFWLTNKQASKETCQTSLKLDLSTLEILDYVI